MHILSLRSYEAKEQQLGDDEEEHGVTFDLQNTQQTFLPFRVHITHQESTLHTCTWTVPFCIYVITVLFFLILFLFVFSSRHPLCPVSVFFTL